MRNSGTFPKAVAEFQGLYGPLQVLEGKIQQVWALQQIQRGDWQTCGGHSLSVTFPGRWNRGPGPDFLEAVIEVDGETRIGDIELHLYREDWWRHGHHVDPAFGSVVLHVVLFAGGMEKLVQTSTGGVPEEWIIGPWMREDLESVAGGTPGLFGELVPELKEWIESDPPEQVRFRLKTGADRRWQDKMSMARCLLESSGWTGGLHRMSLFYLGFPFNRRQFYAMADGIPMERWRDEELISKLKADWAQTVRWGVGRPANRAEIRLRQYIRLNRSVPDWPERLQAPPPGLVGLSKGMRDRSAGTEDTRVVREAWEFRKWGEWLTMTVLVGQLNTSLLSRLWVDVYLPMLAASDVLPPELAAIHWFHARPCQFPDAYREMLGLAGVRASAGVPLCNGWIQGLFWGEDQLRLERIRSSVGPASRALAKPGLTT